MQEEKTPEKFTKYEIARILGARALQIAMNAPLLIKLSKEDLEKIKYDPIKIAEIELESNVLPISVKKPFPGKKEDVLRRPKEQKVTDEKVEEKEAAEEGEIANEGEIMTLVNPEEEAEEEAPEEEGGAEE
ncbi:MAG: DNA-directed RNA polymerase subunit K [Candidatus Pacearchaeota archaeon]|jgi:DNA-directed RNA polymerase subunit K